MKIKIRNGKINRMKKRKNRIKKHNMFFVKILTMDALGFKPSLIQEEINRVRGVKGPESVIFSFLINIESAKSFKSSSIFEFPVKKLSFESSES